MDRWYIDTSGVPQDKLGSTEFLKLCEEIQNWLSNPQSFEALCIHEAAHAIYYHLAGAQNISLVSTKIVYDSSTGRFLSEDPVRFQGGIDFYSYVSNNPVTFVDPSGYKSCCNKPCFVDVRCWPIQKFNLGALGFKHCFVTVRNKDCELRDVSGGPDNNRLKEWNTPSSPQPTAVTYNHSVVPCSMVDCITAMAPVITSLNLPYKSATQNSNSSFATIMNACGLSDLIQYAPGGALGTSNQLLPTTGGGGAW